MGAHDRNFAGDANAHAGFWAPTTSASNFCEEDYAVTLYIAEFINTLTNLAYVYLALRHPAPPHRRRNRPAAPAPQASGSAEKPRNSSGSGSGNRDGSSSSSSIGKSGNSIGNGRRNSIGASGPLLGSASNNLGTRTTSTTSDRVGILSASSSTASSTPFRSRAIHLPSLDPMSAALLLVGVTSFAYHASLRRATQLADELSMFSLAGTLLYPLYASHFPSARARAAVAWALAGLVAAISAAYVRSADVIFHSVAFGALLSAIWPRTLWLIYRSPTTSTSSSRTRSAAEKRALLRRFARAVAALVAAFALWNVDLEACAALRALRQALGLPWAWLLELHGWWHVLTAVGASEYILLVRELCAAG